MADENTKSLNGLALKSRDGYTGKLFLPSTADIATLNTAQADITSIQNSISTIDPTARFIVAATEPSTADDGKIWIEVPSKIDLSGYIEPTVKLAENSSITSTVRLAINSAHITPYSKSTGSPVDITITGYVSCSIVFKLGVDIVRPDSSDTKINLSIIPSPICARAIAFGSSGTSAASLESCYSLKSFAVTYKDSDSVYLTASMYDPGVVGLLVSTSSDNTATSAVFNYTLVLTPTENLASQPDLYVHSVAPYSGTEVFDLANSPLSSLDSSASLASTYEMAPYVTSLVLYDKDMPTVTWSTD